MTSPEKASRKTSTAGLSRRDNVVPAPKERGGVPVFLYTFIAFLFAAGVTLAAMAVGIALSVVVGAAVVAALEVSSVSQSCLGYEPLVVIVMAAVVVTLPRRASRWFCRLVPGRCGFCGLKVRLERVAGHFRYRCEDCGHRDAGE